MLKRAALFVAACAAGAAAIARPAAATDYLKVLDDERVVAPWQVTVGDVESAGVYSADGESIGSVEDILMTADGQIVALSAEVGGFLGIGEREIVLDIDQLAWDGERVVARMTYEQLGSLPAWD